MTTPRLAVEQYKRQQVIAGLTVPGLTRLIERIGNDFDAGWLGVRGRAVELLQLGRAASVHAASSYTADVLAQTGQQGAAFGALVPGAFLVDTPDGFPVASMLDSVPVRAKQAVAQGATVAEAKREASRWLSGYALTMLADTRRSVYQADMLQRPRVTGYVRMLNAPSCPRCVILAGKRFLWNEGFQRHPRCDCIHIPATEQVAGDFRTDPYEYFKSLSEVEQDRFLGKANAQGVRDGADIFQVVNTRGHGMREVGANGRRTGMVTYAGKYKPTLAQIYAKDPSRKFVVENLQYHGYITGPQNPNGNLRGNDPLARILERGRGQGTYSVGGQRVTTNRAAAFDAALSGARDPLRRSTMTAAERRLYDAHYRAGWADAGYRPNSVGANSADRGLGLRPITPAQAAAARERLANEVQRLNAVDSSGRFIEPDQVRGLGRLLGLI